MRDFIDHYRRLAQVDAAVLNVKVPREVFEGERRRAHGCREDV
jgi:hypothetical protein